jgi:hypothetical protein
MPESEDLKEDTEQRRNQSPVENGPTAPTRADELAGPASPVEIQITAEDARQTISPGVVDVVKGAIEDARRRTASSVLDMARAAAQDANRMAASSVAEILRGSEAAGRTTRTGIAGFLKDAETAHVGGIANVLKGAESARVGSAADFFKDAETAGRAGIAGFLKDAEIAGGRLNRELAGLDVSDELRRSFGRTTALTSGLGDALSAVHALSAVPELRPLPNPVYETNNQLVELSRTTRDLVDIAQRQAELSRSLTETSGLSLAETVKSGQQARNATRLAAAGILVSILIASATFYYNSHQSRAADARTQEEIRVLREISREQSQTTDARIQDETSVLRQILRELQDSKGRTPLVPSINSKQAAKGSR